VRQRTAQFCNDYGSGIGCSPGLLLRMQTDYNLQVAQTDSKLNKRLAEIRKAAAVF